MGILKEYSTDNLTLDDLLQDVKRHAGQLAIITGLCKERGFEDNAYAIIREYPNLLEAIQMILNKNTTRSQLERLLKDPFQKVLCENTRVPIKQVHQLTADLIDAVQESLKRKLKPLEEKKQ